MRTTITLDEDVAARLKRLVRTRRRPFRAVVNETLRAGLSVVDSHQPRTRHQTTGFNLGPSLVGSLDNVHDVLSRVEGEAHR
ncbi:MAG TPA: ribbon-helix-helix protein, CopG family [Vicinamibacterales bacterium]|nr:ribbon-helix-helix protein, CopG family [Vicinamibacterales bacterium]